MVPPIRCEQCDAPVRRAIRIPAVSEREPGAHVYRCENCQHVNWRWLDPAAGRVHDSEKNEFRSICARFSSQFAQLSECLLRTIAFGASKVAHLFWPSRAFGRISLATNRAVPQPRRIHDYRVVLSTRHA